MLDRPGAVDGEREEGVLEGVEVAGFSMSRDALRDGEPKWMVINAGPDRIMVTRAVMDESV